MIYMIQVKTAAAIHLVLLLLVVPLLHISNPLLQLLYLLLPHHQGPGPGPLLGRLPYQLPDQALAVEENLPHQQQEIHQVVVLAAWQPQPQPQPQLVEIMVWGHYVQQLVEIMVLEHHVQQLVVIMGWEHYVQQLVEVMVWEHYVHQLQSPPRNIKDKFNTFLIFQA